MKAWHIICALPAGLLSACVEPNAGSAPVASMNGGNAEIGDAASADAGSSMAEGADAKAHAKQYGAAIERHAQENAIPAALANAVIRVESNFNAHIVHAGNYGLTQIKLATARSLGFDGSPSALLDPEINLHFGLKYLGNAYQQARGDLCATIMKYQSGHLAVRLSVANRLYCQRVKVLMAL